jgi:hypothetical protein
MRIRLHIAGALALLFAAASSAAGETYRRAELPQYTLSIYRFLMDWAVTHQLRETAGTGTGTTNQYLRYAPDKALAVCIDWPASTPKAPVAVALGQSWEQRSTARARESALSFCERFKRGRACHCTIVDVNEKSALALPPAFVARHFR